MRIPTLVLCTLAIGCSSPTAPTLLGDWGGKQASLRLAVAGGSVAYLCGAGTIDSAWTITKDGQFSATGSHYFGGRPVPVGGPPPHPARYAGQSNAEFLTLMLVIADLDQTPGTVQ